MMKPSNTCTHVHLEAEIELLIQDKVEALQEHINNSDYPGTILLKFSPFSACLTSEVLRYL